MVTYNEGTSSMLIAGHVTKLVDCLAREKGISTTDCLREFMATKTFAVLREPESYLCLESPEYIRDMYEAEQRGDWDSWLEV
jgi:hypothetical protein